MFSLFFLQVLTNALVSWTPELILICILLFCQCLSLVCFHLLNLLYDSLTDMAIYSLCPLVPGFPCSSAGKESACNAGDPGSVPGLGRSLAGGHGNPLQYSCLEKSHGQRILEGYSQWGCEESDMTEQLHFHFSLFTFMNWRRKWQPTRVLAWRIPGTAEPGGLPSMESQSRTRLK